MTYEELCEFETLYRAYLTARKGKRSKSGTAQYEANALACTERLKRLLTPVVVHQQDGSITNEIRYRPSKFETFNVYEPKKRLVQAPAFVDKVVLHAVVDNILYDDICTSFVRDNAASQKQKGTHDALMRLKHHMVQYYGSHRSADGWVLKADVRKFFASIDHDILKQKLRKTLERQGVDPKIYELLCIYIDASTGLPLGYQTSQLLALLFLDEFDHFIKEKRKCRFYGRYMDDFYIIADSKEELRGLLKDIRQWIGDIKLELNEKTGIFPLKNGIDFLGFHTYLCDTGKVTMKLRRDKVNAIRSRVKYWRVAYPAGGVTKEEILRSFDGWDAHAAHGDTYALREKYAKQVSEIVGETIKPHRKINSTTMAREKRRLRQYKQICKKRGVNESPVSALREPTPNDVPPWM